MVDHLSVESPCNNNNNKAPYGTGFKALASLCGKGNWVGSSYFNSDYLRFFSPIMKYSIPNCSPPFSSIWLCSFPLLSRGYHMSSEFHLPTLSFAWRGFYFGFSYLKVPLGKFFYYTYFQLL